MLGLSDSDSCCTNMRNVRNVWRLGADPLVAVWAANLSLSRNPQGCDCSYRSLSFHLSICGFVFIYLFIYLLTYLFIYLFIHSFIYLFIYYYLFIYLMTYLSI